MIYELREYVAAPGRAAQLHDRFRDHTLALFAKHALPVVGFWQDADEAGRIVYLLAFPDEQAQSAAWAAFQSDPEWKQVKSQSEADGPLTVEMTSRTLHNPEYWAANTTSTHE